jgi:hypothetical protein
VSTLEPHLLRIGGLSVPIDKAEAWVAAYTTSDLSQETPYAYPAYDLYRGGSGLPDVLDDADLLAPVLLNVAISIRSFYALQANRPQLQKALSRGELATPLADLGDDQVDDLIGDLFAVLDTRDALPGIGATKLSKVLHRKRPAAIPLHDRWVRACYVGEGFPVPRAKHRSYRTYMTLLAQAMRRDLREQPDQFAALRSASGADPALTNLRLLDIVAWHAGQRPDEFRTS